MHHVLLAVAFTRGVEVARPFAGPGVRPGEGIVAVPPESMVVVAIAEATVRRAERGTFNRLNGAVIGDLDDRPGLLGHAFRLQAFGPKA